MVLKVVARAESAERWNALRSWLRPLLAARGHTWLDTLPQDASPHREAWIELGPELAGRCPSDPARLSYREGLVTLEAATGAWGPGYHQRALRLVEELRPALSWSEVHDPTGFARHGDRRALEEAFLRHAYALWGCERAFAGRRIGLAWGEGPAEVPHELVATPTGFKDTRWVEATRSALRAALEGAPLSAEGREAFLWWCPEPDAFDWTQLGRAICTSDVIWRALPPAEDAAAQTAARARAVACFEAALRSPEVGAPFPLQELRRLYALLGREPLPGLPARPGAPFRGGYREGWIRQPVGPRWNLALPGWLRAGCDASDGHDVFWDERMTVHLSVRPQASLLRVEEEAAKHRASLPPALQEHARVEWIRGSTEGYALVVTPLRPDPEASLVQGQVWSAGGRVAFTVLARSPELCPLALRLGRSLRPLS